MPRFSFGPAMLLDDLDNLTRMLEGGEGAQANVLLGFLIEDLESRSVPAPRLDVSLPPPREVANMYCEIASLMQACRESVLNGHVHNAAESARTAMEVFLASPWHPKSSVAEQPAAQ